MIPDWIVERIREAIITILEGANLIIPIVILFLVIYLASAAGAIVRLLGEILYEIRKRE